MAFRHKNLDFWPFPRRLRWALPAIASAARASGFSFGSRGARTFSAPFGHAHAPRAAAHGAVDDLSQRKYIQSPRGGLLFRWFRPAA